MALMYPYVLVRKNYPKLRQKPVDRGYTCENPGVACPKSIRDKAQPAQPPAPLASLENAHWILDTFFGMGI